MRPSLLLKIDPLVAKNICIPHHGLKTQNVLFSKQYILTRPFSTDNKDKDTSSEAKSTSGFPPTASNPTSGGTPFRPGSGLPPTASNPTSGYPPTATNPTAPTTGTPFTPLKAPRRKKGEKFAALKETEDGAPPIAELGEEFEPNSFKDLLRKKKWDEVVKLVTDLANNKTPLSKEEYLYLIEHFGKLEDRVKITAQFLEQMRAAGYEPDQETYWVVLNSFAKRGTTDDIVWALIDSLHKKVQPSQQMLHLAIPKIFNKWVPSKKKKSTDAVVDTAGETKADSQCRTFLVFLRDLGIWPDTFIYGLIIKHCEAMGYARTMLKYHEEMKAVQQLKKRTDEQKKKEEEKKASEAAAATTPTEPATGTPTPPANDSSSSS